MTQTHEGSSGANTADLGRGASRDLRPYYRVALAIVAPLPLLAMGVNYLFLGVPAGAEFTETAQAIAADPGVVPSWTQPLGAVFFALLIPAVLAVAAVTWRRVPRLTAAAATLTIPGFAMAFGLLPNDTQLALLTHELDLDVASIAALDEAWASRAMTMVAGLWFIIGIVIGLGMLGVALWRSRQAPAWMGIALALGGATHPFLPNNTAQGVGLIVGAIGFGGASLALLRMRDDDFALPPEPIPTS
jgi:hypothetical protein